MPSGVYKRGIIRRKPLSEETKRKIGLANSIALKGRKLSKETCIKMSESRKGEKHHFYGKKFSQEYRKKLSDSHKTKNFGEKPKCRECGIQLKKFHSKYCKEHVLNYLPRGEKHPLWKGGITPINEKIRKSREYRLWRKAVFERDNYQCIFGGKEHGNKLNADHIKPFSQFPELRFAIDNGRTLCFDCHKKTDTWGRRKGHKFTRDMLNK